MRRRMVCAVMGAMITAAGWSQSLTWLDTRFNPFTIPLGVSAHGSVVVGMTESFPQQSRAFRWTRALGTQYLGTLGGNASVAYGVSANGSAVVGWAHDVNGQRRAFRWRASGGMDDLNSTYANLIGGGATLLLATDVSPDGRYIVGVGMRGVLEAYLLDTGFPRRGDVDRNGCVDDADLLRVLFAFGGRGYRNEDLNWDGIVDDADLLEVLFHFGSGC